MRKLYMIMISLTLTITTNAQNIFTENFDDVPALFVGGGWDETNNSQPLGTEVWHNAIGLAIPAHNGATDAAAEASFNSTDAAGTGTISNWLITPPISINNGDVVSFYTTSYNNVTYPDRLQLRLNPLNTTDVGTTSTSVGDFSVLLVEVNPGLAMDTAMYPQDYWGQFTATISGLAGTTDCRIAFRYFVTDGGGTGTNSSTIGVDALSVDIPVGVNEIGNAFDLNVYPNPVSDRITIDFGTPLTGSGIVYVYNSIGKAVTAFNVQKGQTKAVFNVSSYAAGVYSVVSDTPGHAGKKNFVKE